MLSLNTSKKIKPRLVIIDSVQAMFKSELESSPGTVAQVRQCANELIHISKRTESSIFLVGHVTKQGTIAGPKVLEHLVDTVLYFEGEKFMSFRILRSVKNRFGPTNEIGIFEMCEDGLREVRDPSEIFLSRTKNLISGSAIICLHRRNKSSACGSTGIGNRFELWDAGT